MIDNTKSPNAFTKLAKLDQESTCTLGFAADMVRGLTDGLMKMEEVYACHGFVKSANLNETVSDFIAHLLYHTRRLIMTSYSRPPTGPFASNRIQAKILRPSRLPA